MTLQVNIIKANDLPIADITGSSDPYVKIYMQGSIKTYVGKTQRILKNLNPQWNETFSFPAIRGMKLLLEVTDYDKMSTNNLIAFTSFDPNTQPFGKAITLKLTNVIKKKGEKSSITIMIRPQPNPVPSTRSGINSLPFYITFEPSTRYWAEAPYSNGTTLPYLLPYHLSLIAINEVNGTYEIVSGDNKGIEGANHSGKDICLAASSLTEVIRVDPMTLSSSGYKAFLICISTNNYSPLIEYFNRGELLIWQSNEQTGIYKRNQKYKLDTAEEQMIKLGEKIPFTPSLISNIGVIAGFNIGNSGSIKFNEKSQNILLPTENNLEVTQTLSESISTIIQLSRIISNNKSIQNKITLPLFSPIPVSTLVEKISGQELQTLSVRLTNSKEHNLFAIACGFDKGIKFIGECNPKYPSPNKTEIKDGLKYSSGTIVIDFTKLQDECKFIFVGVTGETPLGTELPAAFKEKISPVKVIGKITSALGNERSSIPMLSITGNTQELSKIQLKLSTRFNSLIWFGLIRDPLVTGGWGLINMCKGYLAAPGTESIGFITEFIGPIQEIIGI